MTSATRQPETPASTVPPRLIATDLDGTLLRDDKSVSPRTVAALAAAEEAGIEVFFVTGRPARWMDVVSDHVHGHGLAICGNGAAVVDLHGGPGAHRFVKIRELAPTSPWTSYGCCAPPRPARCTPWSGRTASTWNRAIPECTWSRRRSSRPPRNSSPRTAPAPMSRC